MSDNESILFIEKDILKVIDKIHFGFDSEVLCILDNVNASARDIELLKEKISADILVRLFNIANSIYWGSMQKGIVNSFYDVVMRLGMDYTKALITFFALNQLSKGNKEVETMLAKDYATSVLARILAEEINLSPISAKKAELAGILMNIGKIIITIYDKFYKPSNICIDQSFISDNHKNIGKKVIDRFSLPPFLKGWIDSDCLVLYEKDISLSSVVTLAANSINESFRKFGNRWVIKALMPDSNNKLGRTIGKFIEDQFSAIGLGAYIDIIRIDEEEIKKIV